MGIDGNVNQPLKCVYLTNLAQSLLVYIIVCARIITHRNKTSSGLFPVSTETIRLRGDRNSANAKCNTSLNHISFTLLLDNFQYL